MEIFLIFMVILFVAFCVYSNGSGARKYAGGIHNRSHEKGKVRYSYRVPYTRQQVVEICLSNKYYAQADAVSLFAQGTADKGRMTKGKWFDVTVEEREEFSILKVTEQGFLTPRTASEVFGLMNAFFVEKLGAVPYEA